jgi:RimJ/RimL family protein N-acetyltransferase
MEVVRTWPVVAPMRTPRLRLDPLRVGDAPSMEPLLADPDLYRFTGGAPPTLQQLRERFMNQVFGSSPDGDEGWFNWVVRLRSDSTAVGTVQATALDRDFGVVETAWVVGAAHQGQGYATEAVSALCAWLEGFDARELCAFIHPQNLPSQRVAHHVGMAPGCALREGDVRWSVRLDGPERTS